MAVTLINVFSVPNGKEDDFVNWWQGVKAAITVQQGFISGKLHRSIKQESRYNFINVAVWEK
jgi:heme-degrading monooxygenase HmoA